MATSNLAHSIKIQASTKHLAEVRQFVGRHAAEFGFKKERVADIRLAVDEAFTNIINHAYNQDASQSVQLTIDHTKKAFHISLFDTGKSFNIDDYQQPDMKEKIKQKKRGGVGVYLISKLMDEVNYLQKGAKNEIRMTKNR